jgi:type IV pilus assembly protein PilC
MSSETSNLRMKENIYDNQEINLEHKRDEASLTEKKFYLFKKVSYIEKSNFFEFLAVMLDSGVNFIQALDSFAERTKNLYFQEKVLELKVYVSSWESLSKAMKKMPDLFGDTETAITEAWEKSGSLVNSLESLSNDFKKIHNLRGKIKWALTYPIIIFLFLIIAVVIVMTYVIPMLKPLFETAQVELPFATIALISTSDFISNYLVHIIIFVILWFVWLVFYRNTPSGKEFFDRFFLSLPLLGNLYRNYIISRISANLWVLISAWVPILKVLTLVGKSTNNVVYVAIFDSLITKVSSGGKIVESMLEIDPSHEYFPSDFITMLSVWEKTASIQKITDKINNQYTIEIDNSLASITKWIEPIAIASAGVFVLWFAFAIFGAILKLTQTVG